MKIEFNKVDTETLPAELRMLYNQVASARDKFEQGMIADALKRGKIKEGQTLRFAYKWGLSIAVDQAKAKVQAW
jgi:hypothetical protein